MVEATVLFVDWRPREEEQRLGTARKASTKELAVDSWLREKGIKKLCKIMDEGGTDGQSSMFLLGFTCILTKATQSHVLLKKQRDMSNTQRFPFTLCKAKRAK